MQVPIMSSVRWKRVIVESQVIHYYIYRNFLLRVFYSAGCLLHEVTIREIWVKGQHFFMRISFSLINRSLSFTNVATFRIPDPVNGNFSSVEVGNEEMNFIEILPLTNRMSSTTISHKHKHTYLFTELSTT